MLVQGGFAVELLDAERRGIEKDAERGGQKQHQGNDGQDSVEGQSRREEQHVMLDDPPRDCPCIEPDGFGNAQRAAQDMKVAFLDHACRSLEPEVSEFQHELLAANGIKVHYRPRTLPSPLQRHNLAPAECLVGDAGADPRELEFL